MTPKTSRSVEALWSFVAGSNGSSLILPDGRCDIIVRTTNKDAGTPVVVVTGPATSAYPVTYKTGDRWAGIRLRPELGAALWGPRIGQAADKVLRGAQALTLLDNLNAPRLPTASLEEIAAWITETTQQKRTDDLARILNFTHTSGGRLRIRSLAQIAHCSERHLSRLFRQNVGISAKMYAQLVQFHRALRLIKTESLKPSDAAYEAGYADHAHLTRAFRRFGSFAPTAIPKNLTLPDLSVG